MNGWLPGRLFGQLRRVGAALLGVFALLVLAPVPGVNAAALTWGAAQNPYLDGLICPTSTGGTSPLASWDFGTGSPAYLLAPVSSTGSLDSAALPYPNASNPVTTVVTPGMDGFSSAADIATYAALLSRPGATSQQIAEIAAAVMTKAGSTQVPTCADAGTAATLLQQAAADAGPYTLSIAPVTAAGSGAAGSGAAGSGAAGSGAVILGQPRMVSAVVRGASGAPVPGVDVTFQAAGAVTSQTSAVTDATGAARTTVTVLAGASATQLTVTASASAPIGLTQRTASPMTSATDPTGLVASAIYPASPVTVSATASLAVDQTASPSVVTDASAHVLALGGTLVQSATVTGMRGHNGTLAFTAYGPVPADGSGACGGQPFSTSTPVASSTNVVPVNGDQRITATPWAPSRAGCYSILASLTTTNATPNSTVNSTLGASGSVITVLATAAQLSVAHPVLPTGPVAASVAVSATNGAHGSVAVNLLGPIPPISGSCSAVDWSTAHTPPAPGQPVPFAGDGTVPVSTAPATTPGCYRLQASLTLELGALGSVAVPVTAASGSNAAFGSNAASGGDGMAGSGGVLVLAPTVTETTDQIWSISPHPVGTHVSVHGTFGLDAHVRIQMMYVAAPERGCRAADWRTAALLATGPAVAVRGDIAELAVESGLTPKLGCYSPVPRVSIDVNPAVTATGAAGSGYTTVDVGVDPHAVAAVAPRSPHLPFIGVRVVVTGSVVMLVQLAAAGVAVRLALRARPGGSRRDRARRGPAEHPEQAVLGQAAT